jgi:hypothetical protein
MTISEIYKELKKWANKPGMVVYAYNPSTRENETES